MLDYVRVINFHIILYIIIIIRVHDFLRQNVAFSTTFTDMDKLYAVWPGSCIFDRHLAGRITHDGVLRCFSSRFLGEFQLYRL